MVLLFGFAGVLAGFLMAEILSLAAGAGALTGVWKILYLAARYELLKYALSDFDGVTSIWKSPMFIRLGRMFL